MRPSAHADKCFWQHLHNTANVVRNIVSGQVLINAKIVPKTLPNKVEEEIVALVGQSPGGARFRDILRLLDTLFSVKLSFRRA